jgi:hypothetical protein
MNEEPRPVRIIEFVFKVKTNANQLVLDNMMDVGFEFDHVSDGDELVFLTYQPTGSYWKDTNHTGINELSEPTKFHFFVEKEQNNAGYGTSTKLIEEICVGFGSDPDAAWEEAILAGRAPKGSVLSDPPSVVIVGQST